MAEPQAPLGYLTSCPHCGHPLRLYVGQPDEAPWVCSECARSWFSSELSAAARADWDRVRGCRRDRTRTALDDISAAKTRGSNVPSEAVHLLSTAQRERVRRTAGGKV